MIRIYVQPNARTGRHTVTLKDGGNSAILVSSTSQGYERLSRAEAIARRIAPRGDEPVELVIRNRNGRDVRREWLWTVDDAGRFHATQAARAEGKL